MAFRRDGAGSDRQFAVEKNRVGDAAHVPELADDFTARGMHRLDDLFPRLYLFFRPDPRRIRVAYALRRDRGGFGEDQPGAGALDVIRFGQRAGRTIVYRAHASQRGHYDAVFQLKRADFYRVIQGWHRFLRV